MNIVIQPRTLSGRVVIPPSKSISHRALICAALAKGESEITGVLQCEDIDATTEALTALGAEIRTENGVTYVKGIEKAPEYAEINCRESGSTLRFIIPVAAALGVEAVFTGCGKLPTRPITPYLEQFPKHGVKFVSDTLPYHIKGKLNSGVYPVTGDISSQFITGLMFAMPLLEGSSTIQLTSPLQSKPYADITVHCMRDFGIETLEFNGNYSIKGVQQFKPAKYSVEGDCSQAAFFAVANALGSSIDIAGINPASVQGDREVFSIIDNMITINGSYSGFDVDASDIPDLVPILSSVSSLSLLQRILRRVNGLGRDPRQPADLAGQGGDGVRRCVHRHADDVHAPGVVGHPHPPDDIGGVLVQQLVQRRDRGRVPDDDRQHGHTGLHRGFLLFPKSKPLRRAGRGGF